LHARQSGCLHSCFVNIRPSAEAEGWDARTWVQAILLLGDQEALDPVSEGFVLRLLWRHRSELLKELEKTPIGKSVKIVAAVLEMSPLDLAKIAIDGIDLSRRLPRLHDQGAELQACAFLLIVGLTGGHDSAPRCVVEGFSSVYTAARHDKLPWDLWRRIEPLLPWHFLEWDRCARLIEGTVTRFLERQWPPQAFLDTFVNIEVFDRAVALVRSLNRRDYVVALRATIELAPEKALPFQAMRLSGRM